MTRKPLKECYIFIKKGIIHVSFLLLLISPFSGHGQKYLVKHYIENDGLANSRVYDIVQDSSGVLWFATRGGISSYDGLNWKTYSLEDGLLATAYEKNFS